MTNNSRMNLTLADDRVITLDINEIIAVEDGRGAGGYVYIKNYGFSIAVRETRDEILKIMDRIHSRMWSTSPLT